MNSISCLCSLLLLLCYILLPKCEPGTPFALSVWNCIAQPRASFPLLESDLSKRERLLLFHTVLHCRNHDKSGKEETGKKTKL